MLFNTEFFADPYPHYAKLREAGPVHRIQAPDGLAAWLVVGHAEVRAALSDSRLSLDKENSNGGYRGLLLPPTLDANLLNMDPPDHTRLRGLVSTAFTPRRVKDLRGRVRNIADELLDAMAPPGRVDLIESFAAPLPITMICELLGVPPEDQQDFRSWSNTLLLPDPNQPSEAGEAGANLLGFLITLIATKRREPGDDLLSAVIAARDNDDRLNEDELISLAFLILFAGYEPSISLVSNGVLALLRHPEQLVALRENEDLLDSAVEEFLRFDGPVPMAIRRFPMQDWEIGGVTIPAGDTVLLAIASANRDPQRCADPDALDIRRADTSHLGFGQGIHFCLGAALGRMEARVAIESLLRRFPNLALAVAEDQLRWRPSFRARSLLALPVMF